MAIGYWIGHWADGKLGTKFCALLGLLVGVYAGFRNLMKAAAIMQKEADREAEEELRKGPQILARAEEERAEEDPKGSGSRKGSNGRGDADAPN